MRTFLEQRAALLGEMGLTGYLKSNRQAAIFAKTINVVQPRNILETGFFAGASAAFWLTLSDARLTSVDPMVNLYDPNTPHDGKLGNVERLKDVFGRRFTFLQKDSKVVRPDLAGQRFDLMFIDGDHWDVGIRNDFQLALDLGIDWLLVDDFVTSVEQIYLNEFQHEYFIVTLFPREDQHEGKPIPMALLRRYDRRVWNEIVD